MGGKGSSLLGAVWAGVWVVGGSTVALRNVDETWVGGWVGGRVGGRAVREITFKQCSQMHWVKFARVQQEHCNICCPLR